MNPLGRLIGDLIARVPVDSHTLGELLVEQETRIEALEARVASLLIRAEQLDQADDRDPA